MIIIVVIGVYFLYRNSMYNDWKCQDKGYLEDSLKGVEKGYIACLKENINQSTHLKYYTIEAIKDE